MLGRPPPRPGAAPAAPPRLTMGNSVRVLLGASRWLPGFVVGTTDAQVKVLLDLPRRSPEFSEAFDAGFDSNGMMWLDRGDRRLRRSGGATRG